jgi:acyl-CoA thioesterase-2
MERDADSDIAAALAETLEFLTVRGCSGSDNVWLGDAPQWFGEYLFGGFVISQAIVAATRDAPAERRLHSMHAYFLRPAVSGKVITYRIDTLREGRTFTTRRLEAAQDGKAILDMTCSLTADTEGYVYDLHGRDALPDRAGAPIEPGPGAWVAAHVGPTQPADDGTRESTHRIWFRVPADLPDDPHLHTALLGFATDWTGIGGRPLHLEGDTRGMISLDHAAWFHRPARANEWLFYDVHSLVNAGGRGLLRGVMRDADGLVVASVAQEMRLAVIEPA